MENSGNRPKELKPIVTAENTRKASKMGQLFFASDMDNVKDYLVRDLIVPKIKETIQDTLNMLFWGNQGSYRTNTASHANGRTNYGGFFAGSQVKQQQSNPNAVFSRRSDVLECVIIYNTPGQNDAAIKAQQVLNELRDLVADYNHATVAEYYQLVGEHVNATDHNYGWKNLDTARIGHYGAGYEIVLPKPEPLNVNH